jgi:hypothetical protein
MLQIKEVESASAHSPKELEKNFEKPVVSLAEMKKCITSPLLGSEF